jgi:tetratricopeptide (TPR) repeat protein
VFRSNLKPKRVLVLLSLLIITTPSHAAVPTHATKASSASVKIGGHVVFSNLNKVPQLSIPTVQHNLNVALIHGDVPYSGQVQVIQKQGQFLIKLGADEIVGVDANVAKAAGTTPAALSKAWADSLRTAIADKESLKQHFTALARGDLSMSVGGAAHASAIDQKLGRQLIDELIQKSQNPRAYVLRAVNKMQDVAKSITALETGEMDPSVEDIEHIKKEFNSSIDDALKGDKTAPGYRQWIGSLYNAAGAFHQLLQEYDIADINFTKASTYMPDDPKAVSGLVGVLLDENKTDEAVRISERAIQTFPKDQGVAQSRARVLISARQFDEAIKTLKNAGPAAAKSSDEVVDLLYTAKALASSGQNKAALDLFNAYSASQESSAGLLITKAMVDMVARDLDNAVKDMKKAQELQKAKNEGAVRMSAAINLVAGSYQDATKSIDASLTQKKFQRASVLYKLILRTILARAVHDSANSTTLAEAAGIKIAGNQAWPRPVLDCLDGKISREQLLSAASNRCEQTEARAYLGLLDLVTNDKPKALENFNWVHEKGNPEFLEYDYSELALGKLNHESK